MTIGKSKLLFINSYDSSTYKCVVKILPGEPALGLVGLQEEVSTGFSGMGLQLMRAAKAGARAKVGEPFQAQRRRRTSACPRLRVISVEVLLLRGDHVPIIRFQPKVFFSTGMRCPASKVDGIFEVGVHNTSGRDEVGTVVRRVWGRGVGGQTPSELALGSKPNETTVNLRVGARLNTRQPKEERQRRGVKTPGPNM
ncbi:hypothetical protein K435DRAFT_802112 [Dendrothele bispora CBS 962.96]|uniref:Uncharacterized protein n=1 Tax=Dendrothele bispora (strain CBS 962.96) TaxID=1314807 RepID=A0A4S8LMG6_DENBC|nr:hypothetical protein K435DRAFT_802112 [Dendrothele bispora CBS 962.96]